MTTQPTPKALLEACQRHAVHLEMRDAYMLDDPYWLAWRQKRRIDPADRGSWWDPWFDTMAAAVRRGVSVRRARIVSEPVSDYIRFEHEVSAIHVTAGEQVRYLPRRRATGLALPGNDFWLFDGQTLLATHFSGDGAVVGRDIRAEAELVAFHAAAFETVWERAISQQDYRPR